MPVEDLRQSPMMGPLLDALDNGEDIGHYGRLGLQHPTETIPPDAPETSWCHTSLGKSHAS